MADRDEILASYEKGTIPQMFVEHIRQQHDVNVAKEFRKDLVALHNSGAIDLLESAININSSTISQSDFFFYQTAFVDIIPELESKITPMINAVKALIVRAGNDLAGGVPNDAFRRWVEIGDRALATLKEIDYNEIGDAAYAFLSLQALAKSQPNVAVEHAIALLEGKSAPVRPAAAKALGTLPLENKELRTRAVNALERAHAGCDNGNLLGHILAAICEIARTAPEVELKALELISASYADADDQVIYYVSLHLMFCAASHSHAIVAALSKIVQRVQIDHHGTLTNIDGAAYNLIKGGRIDEGVALITPLIASHHEFVSLEAFPSSTNALCEAGGAALSEVIADWLLAFSGNLGWAALNLIGDRYGSPLLLDFNSAKFVTSDVHAKLLAYRAIGYLFVHPISAASFVLSLIRNASPKVHKEMEDVLFDPLLISFSSELAEWFKRRANDEDSPACAVAANLIRRLDEYIGGLRNIGHINELRPTERERMIELHRQHEAMRQAHKEAEKKSIFISLARRLVLLYGNRSISYIQDPGGGAQRSVMQLHAMSHSFESPRLDIIEPFDLDYTLRMFRAMRVAQ